MVTEFCYCLFVYLFNQFIFLLKQGDTQIRYFEVTDAKPFVFFLSMFQSTAPQRGCGLLPKRHNEVSKCEVMRFFKLYNNKGLAEPITFAVPRKVRKWGVLPNPTKTFSCTIM